MGVNKPLNASAIISVKKQAVFRFILLQCLLAVFVSLGILVFASSLYWYSFLLGSLTSILPNFYMAWRIFGYKGTRPAKDVVRSFYKGETAKIAMTAVLLSLVFLFIKPLSASAFFAGFGIIILSHWLSPLLLKS